MKTIDELKNLEKVLSQEILPKSEKEWCGARVIVTQQQPQINEKQWFPRRYLITKHSYEVSWFIEKLRDAFYAESRIDFCSKIEFFGRLANTGKRCINQKPDASAHELCAAILHDAFAILEEMDSGKFFCLPIAIGGEIADDHANNENRPGFVNIEKTKVFFKNHGIEIFEGKVK